MSLKYRRIVLKMSGEVLAGEGDSGISAERIHALADELEGLHRREVQVGLVVGGGNIFRGVQGSRDGIDRVTGDHMGMLATVINALAVADALEKHGVPARVLSALPIGGGVVESYGRPAAIRALDEGQLVLFAAGTGNPFFTTDTAGVLRAIEIGADVILKGTKVDGVYDADPMKHKDAKRFEKLSYDEAIHRNLQVMDATAISLSMDTKIPVVVFDLLTPGNIKRVVLGETVGSVIG